MTIGFSQALLNGFGIAVNTRNIRIAKNNRKIADWAFASQAITTITSTITAYWELVYARANVKVNEQAVTVSQKLYDDNKKQLDAGTMAPLDVTRAKSELATDRQNLIVAQTAQLQDEQILKNAITKEPFGSKRSEPRNHYDRPAEAARRHRKSVIRGFHPGSVRKAAGASGATL